MFTIHAVQRTVFVLLQLTFLSLSCVLTAFVYILDIKILLYFYSRVPLAAGYNENLFKPLLLVLSLFPN